MLDGKELGKAIWSKIKEKLNIEEKHAPEKNDEEPKPDPTELLWEAVGEAVCSYLKKNADVMPGIELQAGDKTGATTGKGQIQ
ncbi:MAG: hypothetical protein HRU09_00825 [Oligoflexales bacterium]|nr:hypothetical protein [Oligoflexales bacterium]